MNIEGALTANKEYAIKGALTTAKEFNIKAAITAQSIVLGDYVVKLEPVDGGAQLSVIRGSETQTVFIPSGKNGADGFTFVPSVSQLGPNSAEVKFMPTRSPSLNPQSHILSLPKGDKGDPGKYYTVDLKYLGGGKIEYTRVSSDPDEETIGEVFDILPNDAPGDGGNGGTGGDLPTVSEADNGKVLTVVGGAWAAAELPKYNGAYVVTPGVEAQDLLTAQTFMDTNLKIEKIPYAEVTNAANGVTVTIG